MAFTIGLGIMATLSIIMAISLQNAIKHQK